MVISKQEHFIGIDVGTGSARACIIDVTGEIKALAAQDIKLWQPVSGDAAHYVCLHTFLLSLSLFSAFIPLYGSENAYQHNPPRNNPQLISGTQSATVSRKLLQIHSSH